MEKPVNSGIETPGEDGSIEGQAAERKRRPQDPIERIEDEEAEDEDDADGLGARPNTP